MDVVATSGVGGAFAIARPVDKNTVRRAEAMLALACNRRGGFMPPVSAMVVPHFRCLRGPRSEEAAEPRVPSANVARRARESAREVRAKGARRCAQVRGEAD